jgi:hypothetical protein
MRLCSLLVVLVTPNKLLVRPNPVDDIGEKIDAEVVDAATITAAAAPTANFMVALFLSSAYPLFMIMFFPVT